MRTFIVAMSFIAISSFGALASMQSMNATLVNPEKQKSFVAGNVVWHCDGTACVTASALDTGPKSLCRDLVRKSGPVASFEGLDAAQLEKCNESARK